MPQNEKLKTHFLSKTHMMNNDLCNIVHNHNTHHDKEFVGSSRISFSTQQGRIPISERKNLIVIDFYSFSLKSWAVR